MQPTTHPNAVETSTFPVIDALDKIKQEYECMQLELTRARSERDELGIKRACPPFHLTRPLGDHLPRVQWSRN